MRARDECLATFAESVAFILFVLLMNIYIKILYGEPPFLHLGVPGASNRPFYYLAITLHIFTDKIAK